MPQPRSSTAAPPDGRDVPAAALAAIGLDVAAKGVFGLAWIDRALVVRTVFGPLADFIAVGHPLTDSVPPLIGLEADLVRLSDSPGQLLELPAVSIVGPAGAAPKLNFTAFWLDGADRLLLLVYRASARSDVDVELTRQVRGRLMAEAELEAKSRALEIANRDLEQFATIISHDLDAPLRALRHRADEAETALEADDALAARAHIAEFRAQTRRMSRMMRALLDYASVGRKSEALSAIDTGALVRAVVASLPRPPGIRVEIGGFWPEIETLEAPLDLVLRNLLDNALKHHDRDRGRIAVTARGTASHLEIEVSDDGPGIPAAAREAVFHPFRTLGGPTGGTGMGLALVKRTVESVGGSVRLGSGDAGGRGTTFVVLWPLVVA